MTSIGGLREGWGTRPRLDLLAFQFLAMVAVDGVVIVASVRGIIDVSPLSASLLNMAVILILRRPRGRRMEVEMKSLPALAAAGTIVVQVTGSRIRLLELLSASEISRVRSSFGAALASCYRGEGVKEALEAAAGSLPYQGLKKGMGRLGGGQGVETVGSEAALSGLDLNAYYLNAVQTMETRTSLMQAVAFFSPMISLIAFPRLFAGTFDAAVLFIFELAAMDFASAMLRA